MMEVMASQMSAILLGHSGENGAVRVAFDLTAFQKAFPGGQPLLLVRRYADTTAYPAPLTVEEQTAYWTVGAADTARAGYGQCELQWYLEDGTLAKSDLFDFLVLGTLKTDAVPPDAPSRRWFEAIRRQLGDLSKLTTQAKENLVAAINEAAKTGSGSVGNVALRVSDGYIQFQNGDKWENLIAKSELEGTKGEPGENGVTPTIGANGNWYIGSEDTGKPSRGAPGAAASDAQVSSAVDTWLTEHPEATTTVQDGSVSVEKLGYGKHISGSKPYFCGAVGTGAQVYGSLGVVVPCKAGDIIYTTITVPTNAAWNVPKILTAFPENQYGDIASITLENLAVNNDTKQYAIGADKTTAKALYIPQNFISIPAANNGSVEDALAWINKTMRTDGKWCAQNVPFTELDAWYQTAQTELFDIDESCNKLMYASLYQAVSKLVGAKVAVLGDSLTEQSACSFITSVYNDRWMENVLQDTALTGDDGKTYKGSGWFALIARKYKIKWWCAGHGMQWWYSTTARPNGATAMVRKLIDGTDEFDYIVLEYGTNDILSGSVGTEDDAASETAATSCGAIKWCIEQLQTRFPEASIVVILPNIRSGANGESPAMQQTYLDTVVPILKKYGVRRVNMAEDSGIVKSMMYTDGIHLRWPVVSNNITYYTNDTPAVRKYSKCLEAELLKA